LFSLNNLVDFFNSHPKSVNFSVLVSQSVFLRTNQFVA
jgi:hypothetical protein